jgi:tetratricopeptide (TPR) repeat protein
MPGANQPPPQADNSTSAQEEALRLNNEAVKEIREYPQGAIEKLEQALRLLPTYGKAKANLGRAYLNFGLKQQEKRDYAGAEVSFHKAIACLSATLGPSHPNTLSAQKALSDLETIRSQ